MDGALSSGAVMSSLGRPTTLQFLGSKQVGISHIFSVPRPLRCPSNLTRLRSSSIPSLFQKSRLRWGRKKFQKSTRSGFTKLVPGRRRSTRGWSALGLDVTATCKNSSHTLFEALGSTKSSFSMQMEFTIWASTPNCSSTSKTARLSLLRITANWASSSDT